MNARNGQNRGCRGGRPPRVHELDFIFSYFCVFFAFSCLRELFEKSTYNTLRRCNSIIIIYHHGHGGNISILETDDDFFL